MNIKVQENPIIQALNFEGVKNKRILEILRDQIEMKEKTDNNSRSLKWEQNGELAHKDLSELIERLKNVENEHASSELSRLGTKLNKID